MRTKNLLRSLSLADSNFIKEAKPKKHIPKKYFKYAAIAACLCLITALNLWLFMPFSTTPKSMWYYKGTEYYELIDHLNTKSFRTPLYKNNYELYFGPRKVIYYNESLSGTVISDMLNENYIETTDNQVSGVIEGDIIKRSDKYIYHIDIADHRYLSIWSIDGADSEQLIFYRFAEFDIIDPVSEMYLSEDCTTLFLICHVCDGLEPASNSVEIVSLDVTDPYEVKKTGVFSVKGNYLTSRYVNGQILLMTQLDTVRASSWDFDDANTFVPSYTDATGTHLIPMEDIIIGDYDLQYNYTVVCSIDAQTLNLNSSKAILHGSDVLYVSQDNIYVCCFGISSFETEIFSLRYSDASLALNGSVKVDGTVINQYCMDEYDGTLRVVSDGTWWNNGGYLSCIDLESFEIVATVTDFVPEDESIMSVRFDKDRAYVCTAIVDKYVITDPVFFFDLSDLNNITYKDTGEIEGYSSSLVNFGDGYLLGIGFGETTKDMKLEIYAEGENGVECVCEYVLANTQFSEDYKAYFIDRENKLIGLGVKADGENERYLLLHFNGESLVAYEEDISSTGDYDFMRATLIDGYVYFFSTSFDVISLDEIITN